MGVRRLVKPVWGAMTLALLAVPATASAASSTGATHYDTSPPLSSLSAAPFPSPDTKKEKPKHRLPDVAASSTDPVAQSTPLAAAAPSTLTSFEGIGQGFLGANATGFNVTSAPPDPNGAVSSSYYVEVVNQDFTVYQRSPSGGAPTPVLGPEPTNTIWSGFGGGCQSNDDGDATIKYDQLNDRWIISQFSVSTTPYLQCVAVSATNNPTGAWNRYSFATGSYFPDYPKLGVWPDGYYTTFNLFNGNSFVGPQVCAYESAAMRAGQPARQLCQQLSSAYASLLPSDVDGSSAPPAGEPDFLAAFTSGNPGTLDLWKYSVSWGTSPTATLGAPTPISVANFAEACGGGTCVPQPGTNEQLDSLGDRLMYRLAYRNFGDHESLVVAHSVSSGTTVGVRWYELRNPNGTPSVYQQGTYDPADGAYRWMPSVAMDRNGDIALGYSISSSSLPPGIRYTVHAASDPLGQMETEGTIQNGIGSQLTNLNRWGDYSSMAVDPADDCTFWYTNEYLQSSGTFNWNTRIGTFKLPSCSSGPDFSLVATPSNQSVNQGTSASYTVNVNSVNGDTNPVKLSVSGLPTGVAATFSPNPVTPGSSSTMTVPTSAMAPGTYNLTITGTDSTNTTLTHSTSVTLVVTAPDFSLSATPTSQSANQGSSVNYTVTETPSNGYSGTVGYSVSGLPASSVATYTPTSTGGASGGSTVLQVTPASSTPAGSYQLTVTGSDGTLTHSQILTLTVNAVPQAFSLSPAATSLSVQRGHSVTDAIAVKDPSGGTYYGQAVSLSASGLPNRSSASFSPNPAASSSTLTVSTSKQTSVGTYTLHVNGSVGTFANSATVTLQVHS